MLHVHPALSCLLQSAHGLSTFSVEQNTAANPIKSKRPNDWAFERNPWIVAATAKNAKLHAVSLASSLPANWWSERIQVIGYRRAHHSTWLRSSPTPLIAPIMRAQPTDRVIIADSHFGRHHRSLGVDDTKAERSGRLRATSNRRKEGMVGRRVGGLVTLSVSRPFTRPHWTDRDSRSLRQSPPPLRLASLPAPRRQCWQDTQPD
jgi:hypothetical protein